MTTTIAQLYEQLAVRINYPITPTYRCIQKVIGFINLLLSYVNTPQFIEEVTLSGEAGRREYNAGVNRISYLYHGQPVVLNPDGTINTNETKAYIIHKYLIEDSMTEEEKPFVTSEQDILVSDNYVQPFLTALYLLFQGINPTEAVMYINSACTSDNTESNFNMIDVKNIKKKL